MPKPATARKIMTRSQRNTCFFETVISFIPEPPRAERIKYSTSAHAFEQAHRVVIGIPTVAGWSGGPFQRRPSRTRAGRRRISIQALVQTSLKSLPRFVPSANPVYTRGFVPLGRGLYQGVH